MKWTEQRITTMTTMWAEGLSATEIAKTLGYVSRGAVLGKLHRMDLMRKLPGRAHRRPKPIPRAIPVPVPPIVSEPFIEPEPSARTALFNLTDKSCRFPIGDVGTPDFGFCGRTPRHHSPYCAEHHKRCFVPLTPRHRAASESGGIARNARALEEVA
jgi:GcrA cell cycle regulator